MRCERCSTYVPESRVGEHKCPPGWRVFCPDWGETVDDAVLIYAFDQETALTLWARHYDEENALVDCREPVVVHIWRDGDDAGTFEPFHVWGETCVTYSARPVSDAVTP